MFPSARRRPGTSPSFWRAYHKAQLGVVASSTRMTVSRAAEEPTVQRLIIEYEKTKKPAAAHFVSVGR